MGPLEYLSENPAPIWVVGAILLTVAGIVYSSLRSWESFLTMVLVVLLAGVGLFIEWSFQTPREQVQQALQDLLEAVEADDLEGVVGRIDPAASTVRADVQTQLPRFEILKARALSAIEVVLDDTNGGATADAEANILIQAEHRQSGMRGGKAARVVFQFRRTSDGAWLLEGYSATDDWRRGAEELSRGR